MHRADITKPAFPGRRRYWIMALAMVLFLPPLSFLFQFTGDSNFCGTWCPRMFFVWRKGASLDAYFMGYLRSYMGVALVFGILLTTFFRPVLVQPPLPHRGNHGVGKPAGAPVPENQFC